MIWPEPGDHVLDCYFCLTHVAGYTSKSRHLFRYPSLDSAIRYVLHLDGSVGKSRNSWWGGPGFDSRCDRPLRTGRVGVSIMWPAEAEVIVYPLCLLCGSTLNCQTSVLGPVRDIA